MSPINRNDITSKNEKERLAKDRQEKLEKYRKLMKKIEANQDFVTTKEYLTTEIPFTNE